jgi:hypothetical protein
MSTRLADIVLGVLEVNCAYAACGRFGSAPLSSGPI